MAVSYRFDPDYTVVGRHYAYPLVSWPAVIGGALAAIAVGFLLNMVGLAIGASAFNPYKIESQDEVITIGGGLYVIFAQFVAFQVGAFIASRSARYPDHFGGLLNGFMVWALAVFVGLALATLTAGQASGSDALPAGAAETIGELADAAEGEGANAGDLAAAEDTADALAVISWWTVGALSLGLAGAVAGGWLGAHHPNWSERPRLDDRSAYQPGPEV